MGIATSTTVLGYYSLILLLVLGMCHIGSKDAPGVRVFNFMALVPIGLYVVQTLFGPHK